MGGVSMFINNTISFLNRDDIIIDVPNVDLIAIEIPKEQYNSKRNIVLLTLYRPPDINPNLFIKNSMIYFIIYYIWKIRLHIY